MKIVSISIAAFFALTLFTACGNDQSKETKDTTATTTEAAPQEPAGEVTLTISGNDKMQYDLNELKVKAGQKVTLTMKNEGTMPKASMGHNWVLFIPYVDIEDFAKKAQDAGIDNDYIPASESQKIIAHTKLLGPGESDTITFTAPEEGEYDYICSFPGHHSTMKGKLIVEK